MNGPATIVRLPSCDVVSVNDPTGTAAIRKAFRSSALLRLRVLRGLLRVAVIDHDVLNMASANIMGTITLHPIATRQQAFHEWLQSASNSLGGQWYRPFIQQAWHAGELEAHSELHNELSVSSAPAEHLVQLAHQELLGIRAAIVQQVSRAATSAMNSHHISRANKFQTYQFLAQAFDKAGSNRLNAMCNVLVIKAYNQAKITVYRNNNIQGVGIKAERRNKHTHDAPREGWSSEVWPPPDSDELEAGVRTAGDDLVCQQCEDIAEDAPYTLDEAMELLPAHPNCRCSVYAWDDARRRIDRKPDLAEDAYDPDEPRDEHGRWIGNATDVPFRGSRHGAEKLRAYVQKLIDAGVRPVLTKLDPKDYRALRATQSELKPPDDDDVNRDPLFAGLTAHPVVLDGHDGNYHVLDGHNRISQAYKDQTPITVYLFKESKKRGLLDRLIVRDFYHSRSYK